MASPSGTTAHSAAEGIGVGVSFGGGESIGFLTVLAIAVHNVLVEEEAAGSKAKRGERGARGAAELLQIRSRVQLPAPRP